MRRGGCGPTKAGGRTMKPSRRTTRATASWRPSWRVPFQPGTTFVLCTWGGGGEGTEDRWRAEDAPQAARWALWSLPRRTRGRGALRMHGTEVLTWKRMVSLASGAVTVLLTHPATPPARSSFTVRPSVGRRRSSQQAAPRRYHLNCQGENFSYGRTVELLHDRRCSRAGLPLSELRGYGCWCGGRREHGSASLGAALAIASNSQAHPWLCGLTLARRRTARWGVARFVS